jgi:hypothetical protein
MFIFNKRGDVNWFVVSIILAVITLAVFVLIFVFFPFQQTIDRAACKESILLKAILPGGDVPAKDLVSVRCKSRVICLTTKASGKGNCTGIGKTYETQRLSATTVIEQKEQIRMFLAREMADCWNMFGEGKLQIFSRAWKITDADVSKGIICDKIEFDDSILFGKDKDDPSDDIKNITGLVQYMTTHKVPTQNYSYMDYLRNTPEGDSAAQLYGSLVPIETSADLKNSDFLNLTGVKAITYIETTNTNLGKVIAGTTAGAAIAAVCIFVPGASSILGKGVLVLAGGGSAGNIAGVGLGYSVLSVVGDFGDWLQGFFVSGPLKDSVAVGGLVLTDYSKDGFEKYGIQEFQNV